MARILGVLALGLLLVAARLARAEGDARVDAFGDPLPEGVVARYGTVRLRHAGDAWPLGFSADSKTLCTGGDDYRVRWWDFPSGRLVRELRLDDREVPREVSKDGRVLLSTGVGHSGFLRVRDSETGKALFSVTAPGSRSVEAALSRDGKEVYGTLGDRLMRVWDSATGGVLAEHVTESDWWYVSLSPDGTLVASYWYGGPTLVWSAKPLAIVSNLTRSVPAPIRLAFSPDSSRIAVIDTGDKLVVWNRDPLSRIFDVQLCDTPPPVASVSSGLAFSPDGALLAANAGDAKISLLDSSTGKVVRSLPTPGVRSGQQLVFSHDGTWIAAGLDGDAVGLWRVATAGGALQEAGNASGIVSLAFSPDGRVLVSGGAKGDLVIWDASTHRPRTCLAGFGLEGQGARSEISFSPDGTRFATPLSSGSGAVWRANDGTQVMQFEEEHERVSCVAFLPDGVRLAVGYTSGALDLLDSGGGKRIYGVRAHQYEVGSISVSPDGRHIATGSIERDALYDHHARLPICGARIWEVEGGKEALDPGIRDTVSAIAFSSDGGLLAIAPDSYHLVILEMETGSSVLEVDWPISQRGVGGEVAFSPDGRWIAERFDPEGVRTLDLSDGRVLEEIHPRLPPGECIAISPDGKRIAIGMQDSTIEEYEAPKPPELKADENVTAEEDWKALASADAREAYRAQWRLVARGDAGTDVIERRLPPAEDNGRQIDQWITDLDADDPSTRDRATTELSKLGPELVPRLQQALADNPSAEKKARLTQVLLAVRTSLVHDPEEARALRAIRVLALIRTPRAKEALARLAKGSPQARQTSAAQWQLQRLAR